MLAQRNVNYLVFASLVMISSKLRTYLDHLRWGSEAIPFKIVNDVSFTHRNVNSFISHRTWWFVWLRSAIYYYNERSSYSKSQCQRRRFEDNNKMLAHSCWKPGHELPWHELKPFACVALSSQLTRANFSRTSIGSGTLGLLLSAVNTLATSESYFYCRPTRRKSLVTASFRSHQFSKSPELLCWLT